MLEAKPLGLALADIIAEAAPLFAAGMLAIVIDVDGIHWAFEFFGHLVQIAPS